MMSTRSLALLALSLFGAASLSAQGITSGAVSGTVTNQQGAGIADVQVTVTNASTGFSVTATTRTNGYYFVQGLEVSGNYKVAVRRLGMVPQTRDGIVVGLSRTTRADFVMAQAAQVLTEVVTTAAANEAEFSQTRQGVATIVVDSIIRRLPTLQRDFMDLVKLTPQVVPGVNTGGGPSAAGGYNRLNNFTVDGANQNDRFNLGSSGGQPGGATGGRIMSQEAVKEFQVMLSPTDVRYGNFAGMMVNAVTKSGTNTLGGGIVYAFRTPDMAANIDAIRTSGFDVKQFGGYIGGPIIKDKLHFFVAPEWQARTDPTSGTTVGDTTACGTGKWVGTSATRVCSDSIALIQAILGGTTGFGSAANVGTAGAFPRKNPLLNIMARLDWSINASNRAVLRVLDNTAEQDELSRNVQSLQANPTQQSSGIRLTSNSFSREAKNRSIAGQLFTNLANGMSNEFLIGYNTVGDKRIVPVTAPEISVGVTPIGGAASSVAVTAGTERFSPGNDLQQKIFELSDNFSIPYKTHTFTVGGRFEATDVYNYFLSGAGNGAWRFTSLTQLQNAAATPATNFAAGYAFSYANGGDIAAKFKGNQISLYAQDMWNVTPTITVTGGIRMDRPSFKSAPLQNAALTALAGAAATSVTYDGRTVNMAQIRTDNVPDAALLWSPRIGVNWDVGGKSETQVRANVGIFTGFTPYILIGNAFSNTGMGGVTVGCTVAGQVPQFTTDVSALPKSCLGLPAPTAGAAGTVGINVTDPNFKYPQNFTGTFGVDRRLPYGILGTFEALYRQDINALYIRDLNLKGPRTVGGVSYKDVHGRVMYADTITVSTTTGNLTVTNANQKRILTNGTPVVNFSEGAIELTNAKAGHNYSLMGQARKRFNRAFELTAAYTYTQAKDVQSLTSDRAISNWRFGRQHAGYEYDPEDATTSNFQRPHRFIGYGTWTGPWKKYQTDVTFYMEAISGISMTYVTNNDINGDGVGGNDPIYVPRDAADAAEFRVGTGIGPAFALSPATAASFNKFIELQPCLDEQRGSIMKRNSCQGPMLKRMDVSVRQSLSTMGMGAATLQLDVFNFMNLLNKKWGQNWFPVGGTFNNQTVLQTASRQAGALSTALWNYNVPTAVLNAVNNTNSPWAKSTTSTANNYQMQLTLRYAY